MPLFLGVFPKDKLGGDLIPAFHVGVVMPTMWLWLVSCGRTRKACTTGQDGKTAAGDSREGEGKGVARQQHNDNAGKEFLKARSENAIAKQHTTGRAKISGTGHCKLMLRTEEKTSW